VELKADTEHQQNDADFGQLLGHRGVGDEAGSVRSHQRARQEVTDNRRQPEALGDETKHEGGRQAAG
jgi:hypothetical protein